MEHAGVCALSTASVATSQPSAPAWKIWSALSIVYVVWGSTYLAIRIAVRTMPPLLKAGTRFMLAGGILWLIAASRGGADEDPIRRVHWRSAFIIGGLLLLGGNGGVVLAEQTVSSSVAALMIAAIPLWFAVFARIFFGERMRPIAVAGLVVGFAGIAILSLPSSGRASIDPKGAALLFVAPMFWASGSLYTRRAPLPKRPLVATSLEMVAGGICLLVAGIAKGELSGLDLSKISQASWIAYVYLVFIGSLVAFTAYIWVLGHAKTSLVSTYAYVNPVVAVFLGWSVLSEPITTRVILGAAVILAGVAMIVSASAKRLTPMP